MAGQREHKTNRYSQSDETEAWSSTNRRLKSASPDLEENGPRLGNGSVAVLIHRGGDVGVSHQLLLYSHCAPVSSSHAR